MSLIAPILQGLASLGWVIFAFTVLFLFRCQIAKAFGRLTKGELLGQKFELQSDLAVLESSVAASATIAGRISESTGIQDTGAVSRAEFDPRVDRILEQAATAPKVALMSLADELERQSIQGLAARGLLRGRNSVPTTEAFTELQQYGLPENLKGSLNLFLSVRNKIIHGRDASDDDALRALDSGMTILRAIKSLPLETYFVDHPGVEVYSDSGCTRLIPGVKGVILDVTSPGGVQKRRQIFPTTRLHFQKGKQVAWEWETSRTWPEAWYRDPNTGQALSAWGGSCEFIGRHLDDVYQPTP